MAKNGLLLYGGNKINNALLRLLLIHGTIYGSVGGSEPPINAPGAQDVNGIFDIQAGYFHVVAPTPSIFGKMIDNAPIDMIHWTAKGTTPTDASAIWRQCIMLLSRA